MQRVDEYTVEIYKADKRLKEGKKRVEVMDLVCTEEEAEIYAAERITSDKYTYVIRKTYRTVRNLMSGEEVRERYDTPYYLSVGSESYWSA